MRKTIYVDVDGTLLHKEHDMNYLASGCDLEWYNSVYVDHLAVNFRLVHILIKLKKRGNKLVLWTNRGEKQVLMTMANLAEIWFLFDEHHFYNGKKFGTNVDGYTFDNEVKYINKGILIDW